MWCGLKSTVVWGCAIGLYVPLADAGAWSLPKNQLQVISTSSYSQADALFNSDEVIQFTKFESRVFFEYGLNERWTFVGQGVVQSLAYESSMGPVNFMGLGESSLGVRYRLYKGINWVISIQPSLIIDGEGETVADADLGYGGSHVELRVLAGLSRKIFGSDGFAELQLGRRFRSLEGASTLSADITLGYYVSKKGQVIGQLFYTYNRGADDQADIIQTNESLKLELSYVRRLKVGQSIQFAAFQAIAGRNIIKEHGLMVSLWQLF